MFDLNLIQDNSIIITSNKVKKEIISLINSIDLNVKFISKEELKRNIFFHYDDKTIKFLMDEGYSFDNANELIENLYFLKNGNEKLDTLISLKDKLDQMNLLKYNYLYKYLFSNKKVYIYKYSKYDKELILLLEYINVKFTYLEDIPVSKKPLVYQFKDINEEVDSCFNMVCNLVKNNVPIEKIKLFKYPKEYDLAVKKYARFYNLPINFKKEMNLYSSFYFKQFLKIYENNDLIESYNLIQDLIQEDNYHFLSSLKQLLIDIYGLFENKIQERSYIISKAKNIYLSNLDYEQGIDIVDDDYVSDDYIFILGFNLSSYPSVNKDVLYLNDDDRKILGINTSLDNNLINEQGLINFINSHSNLFISYKVSQGKKVFYPSLIIDKLHLEVEKNYQSDIQYSLTSSKLKVANFKDIYKKYGIDNKFVNAIENDKLNYCSYDYQFKEFKDAKNDGFLQLSFSKIDSYFSCPFKYYVNTILKLDEFEEKFTTVLGTFYHRILEENVDSASLDIEKYQEEIISSFSTYEEKYFAKKFLNQISKVIEFNKEFLDLNPSLNVEVEKEVKTYIDSKTLLSGKIDKVIISKKDHALMIVDYKTYSMDFNKDGIEHGLYLQLPIYSYMMKKVYSDYKQFGVYIQNVLADTKESLTNLRLKGITKKDRDLIGVFDKVLTMPNQTSKFIQGLRTNSVDYYKSNGLLEKDEWDQIANLTIEKLKEAVRKIRSGEFKISPYRLGNKTGCEYCNNKDICFVKSKDYRDIILKKEGDKNE